MTVKWILDDNKGFAHQTLCFIMVVHHAASIGMIYLILNTFVNLWNTNPGFRLGISLGLAVYHGNLEDHDH